MIAAGPFLWTLWGSFKVEGDFFSKADWKYALYGVRTAVETGGVFTGNGYHGAWVQEEFWRAAINTGIVVASTVVISLTLGTLGGYALARSGYRYAFWLLMAALVFRAMPHITLVSGYLLPFFQWNIWGYLPTTIIVLVAINQPFTLWMLHSFFLNIPKDMDESAMVDGCTRFQAFCHVIIPVMWPGVITTGLFSFLLAYNDFAVTAMLLSQENQTIKVVLSRDKKEKNVILSVIDEGEGFKESDTSKVFKRFYSNRPNKFGEHSGLGLNIVKNLVELHNGKISASNNVGQKGAIIEIIFPKV